MATLFLWGGVAFVNLSQAPVYEQEGRLQIGHGVVVNFDGRGASVRAIESSTELARWIQVNFQDLTSATGPRLQSVTPGEDGDYISLVARAQDPQTTESELRKVGELVASRHGSKFAWIKHNRALRLQWLTDTITQIREYRSRISHRFLNLPVDDLPVAFSASASSDALAGRTSIFESELNSIHNLLERNLETNSFLTTKVAFRVSPSLVRSVATLLFVFVFALLISSLLVLFCKRVIWSLSMSAALPTA